MVTAEPETRPPTQTDSKHSGEPHDRENVGPQRQAGVAQGPSPGGRALRDGIAGRLVAACEAAPWLMPMVRTAWTLRCDPGAMLKASGRGDDRPPPGATFVLGTRSYPYLVHPYNRTWSNERAVEVPVAREFIAGCQDADLLELGNVLSHYLDRRHTVIDKYERCVFRRVLNQDILEFAPGRTYNCIVSISTIEHVGWDESPREPEKALRALDRLRSLLSPGGQALVTVPFGYNAFLDDAIRRRAIPAARIECMRRTSASNLWAGADLEQALACGYGAPFPVANGVAFITLEP